MISFDFDYYRPRTVEEAVGLFDELEAGGKSPLYYGGGTEIISMGRAGTIETGAVIDIKTIPECREHKQAEGYLTIGSAVTLTEIAEANHFPLLTQTVKRVADHTIQDKVTLGGHICGLIIYHEGLLPLMVSDSEAVVADKDGLRTVPLSQVYEDGLKLRRGMLLVQLLIRDTYLQLPHYHTKQVKKEKIDYPLITAAALLKDEKIRIAFSGLCDFPFRSGSFEAALNQTGLSVQDRVRSAVSIVPAPVMDDIRGSADYRRFVLGNIVEEAVAAVGMERP